MKAKADVMKAMDNALERLEGGFDVSAAREVEGFAAEGRVPAMDPEGESEAAASSRRRARGRGEARV